jgi:hypothetical protein
VAPARVTGYLVERYPGEQPDGCRAGALAPSKGGASEGGAHAHKDNEVA